MNKGQINPTRMELMKLKNQNPDMDIAPYLQRAKGKGK